MPSVEFEENKTKDQLFAKIAIKKKMATQEQAKSCLEIQRKKDKAGTYIPLYKVFIGKSVLSQTDAKEILKEVKGAGGGSTKRVEAPKKGATAAIRKTGASTSRTSRTAATKAEPSTSAPRKIAEGKVRIGRELMTAYKIKFGCSCGKEQALPHKFIGKSGACTACKKALPVPHPDDPSVICLVCDCGKEFDKNSGGCTFCGLRKPPTPSGANASGKVDIMQQLADSQKADKKARAAGKKVESLVQVKSRVRGDRLVKHDDVKPKKNPMLVYFQFIFLPFILVSVVGVVYYRFTSATPIPREDPTTLTAEQLENNTKLAEENKQKDKKEEAKIKRENAVAKLELVYDEIVAQAMACYPSNLTRINELIAESPKKFKNKYPYHGDLMRIKAGILYNEHVNETKLNGKNGKKGAPAQELKKLYEGRIQKLTLLLELVEAAGDTYRKPHAKTKFKLSEGQDILNNNLATEYKTTKDARRDLDYFFDLLKREKEEYKYQIEKLTSFDFGEDDDDDDDD